MPNKKIIDYTVVEDCAYRGVSKRELASLLGIHEVTIYARTKDDTQFRAAWNRGLERRNGNGTGQQAAPSRPTANMTAAQHRVLSALLHRPLSLNKIADAASMSYSLVVETIDELENEGRVRENDEGLYERVPDDEQAKPLKPFVEERLAGVQATRDETDLAPGKTVKRASKKRVAKKSKRQYTRRAKPESSSVGAPPPRRSNATSCDSKPQRRLERGSAGGIDVRTSVG